ncbi:unnamed protein product [Cuscuta campestris]|uniref:CCHC-type domain-containing protein n=1 Tax=Cuscuta campestris TaxID=132261 RepID=A0A484MYY4_9ASTE|nr:unnamed protein product [Cuscuta campestris]
MPPLVMPQVAYEQMFPAMMAHYMQHMAQLMPMFQPLPPPQPQPRIVTFKTLNDNGAEEFRGDRMGEPQIALDWLEQMDRVLKNLRVPDADRSELASQMFRKGAYDWWKRIDQDPHTPKPWTLDRFDRAFTKEYKFDYLSQYATSLVSTPEDRLNEFVKKLRPDLTPYAALITMTDFNAAYDLIMKTEKSLDDLQAAKKEDRVTKDPRPAASTRPSGKSFGFGGKRYEKGSSSAPPPKRSKSKPSPSAAASNSIRTRSHPQCVQCGRHHPGECWLAQGLCLGCGQPGHFRRHCPTNPSSEPVFPRAPDRIQHGVSSLQQQIISRDHVRSRHSMRLHHIYHRCPLSVQGKQFPADLIELPHKEFDIILGMDWLTEHRAVVDCSCRTVRLRAEDGSDVSLSGEVFPKAPEFISSLSARRLIRKKCEMFLCHVQDMRKESPRQQDIHPRAARSASSSSSSSPPSSLSIAAVSQPPVILPAVRPRRRRPSQTLLIAGRPSPDNRRRCFLRQRSAVSISVADDSSPRRAAVRRLHCQRRSSSSSSYSAANRRCFAFAGSPPLFTVERRQSPPAVALSSGRFLLLLLQFPISVCLYPLDFEQGRPPTAAAPPLSPASVTVAASSRFPGLISPAD